MSNKKKRKSNKGRKIVVNNGCMYDTPCLYYPDCQRGDSCWYQHLQYESDINEETKKATQKAKEIVTPNNELLSHIYQMYQSKSHCPKNYLCFKCKSIGKHWIMNCPKKPNKSVKSDSNCVLRDLASKLCISNDFKILQIGKEPVILCQDSDGLIHVSMDTEATEAVTFDEHMISINTLDEVRIIDILSLIQHYNCHLDEIAVDIWRYSDMHELSCAICNIFIPSNREVHKLDLSYFNFGFHTHDFNNICQTLMSNCAFVTVFGISGRSQSQSMILNVCNLIQKVTSLTEIKLKLIRDQNGGCCKLDIQILIDALFENEIYLESQIDQIGNCLNHKLSDDCVMKIIDFCFGKDVFENELQMTVDVNVYGEYMNYYDDDDYICQQIVNEKFKQLESMREINKSIITRKISFKLSTCYS
eukprot:157889_1